MILEKIVIKNYKTLEDFTLSFNENLNILVGNNEVGKSTVLEAINLVFTGQLNGVNLSYELSPFLFNDIAVKNYLQSLNEGKPIPPPSILIEAYLKDCKELSDLTGTNNTLKENCPGIYLLIQYNEGYAGEYAKYIADPKQVTTIPIEYYEIKCYSFADNLIPHKSIPIIVTLIDTSSNRRRGGTDQYISKIIHDILDDKDKAQLALNFRKLKETFGKEDGIKNLNAHLKTKKGDVSEKELSVSVDISPRSNWEANLMAYLDDIPFSFIGKGEQNSIKMKLSLESNGKDSHLILIEEPENHLSYSNMNRLISKISEKCEGKQLIMTTHSTFVLNKLGLENVILVNDNQKTTNLSKLPKDTYSYFKRLPGYDTLRLLLSDEPILVEGPSDELIVQKAYLQTYGLLPIEDGTDVISMRSLAFKRFLDIATALEKDVHVVIDNDGKVDRLNKIVKNYEIHPCVHFHFDANEKLRTLEYQIVECNDLALLNEILGTKAGSKEELIEYMIKKENKTECALKIFESKKEIIIPKYIQNAIEE